MGQSFQEFGASLPAPLTLLGERATTVALVAKRVRAELAIAVERGIFPDAIRFSVRLPSHGSITVEIVAWPGAVFTPEYSEYIMDPTVGDPRVRGDNRMQSDSHLAPELKTAITHATAIADRHNYNHSDIASDYFNYGYSLTVSAGHVESIVHRTLRAESDPRFAALQAKAADAALALGDKAVRSICGRVGLEGASEWTMQRLARIADRAAGRPVEYDKKRRGWFPVGAP